jgi:glycosyltransferase involved in cell wall biosynthesis
LIAGGRERRLVELIKGLKKKDIDIKLILLENQIHYKEIFDLNIEIVTLNRVSKHHKVEYFFKIYKHIKSFKPDIVHVWSNLSAFYLLPSKFFGKFKLINSQIVNAPEINKISFITKLNFYFSDLILSNSIAGLKSYGVNPAKSDFIHNGFDPSRLKIRVRSSLMKTNLHIKTKFVVGMAARFSNHKDYESYLTVANRIISVRSDVTFICFGAGDFKSFKNKFSHSRLLFLGKIYDVESVMNICDIGVLLSNYYHAGEGISNALLEFMALGTPVIATDNGGNKELVNHGYNGYVLDKFNNNDLTEKYILTLLDNLELRYKLGLNAKATISKKFNLNDMVSKFYKNYKNLISFK